MASSENKAGFAFADYSALTMGTEAARFFGKNDDNFRELIDSLALGNVEKAVEVGRKAGLSRAQASLLVRDSTALAAAMGAIGEEMSW